MKILEMEVHSEHEPSIYPSLFDSLIVESDTLYLNKYIGSATSFKEELTGIEGDRVSGNAYHYTLRERISNSTLEKWREFYMNSPLKIQKDTIIKKYGLTSEILGLLD